MAADSAALLVLQVEPCENDPSRYRWLIRDRDHVVRRSCYSLASEEEARTEGEAALQEAAAMLRDSS
ncbi:hypothetical protein [Methylobacterium segetis]|uniref:hypothetical protein n=1 Tax=Methylobacterium segetis TaxID=2488750 RepID=UPI001050CB01|nr:hypothetical protein [Methylobacterium segetis]